MTPRTCSVLLMLSLVGLLCATATARDPDAPPTPLTLDRAIQFGLDHYPAVQAALARVQASRSGIDLAETAYLPRLDVGYQGLNGTFNNVSGVFFPNPFTLPISGPDLGRTSYSSAWGSAAGVAAGWEPFDFGLRQAQVETARSVEHRSTAEAAQTQLNVGLTVGDAYLSLAAAQERVAALQADVDHRTIFADTVQAMVESGLRPGADASRAIAELARARTDLIQAEQAQAVARETLAEVLGVAGERIDVHPGPLLALPEAQPLLRPAPETHPTVVAQQAAAEVLRHRKEELDLAWVPRFELQTAFFSRGTGWNSLGERVEGLGGLAPDVPNWAAGLTVTFSLLDFASIRAKRRMAHHREQAERAGYEEALQTLRGRHAKAVQTVKAARRIAQNTPTQLSAAREAETQARARFRAGLSSVVEVVEAQALVVRASLADAFARLGVWRSLLGLAGAQGDLDPFLALVRHAMPRPGP